MPKLITIQNLPINIQTSKDDNDYISLTDMAKWKGEQTGVIIANWLTTKFTQDFMSAWEQMHNSDFNLIGFHNIRNETGSNGFIVSSSMWIKATNAIGIKSSSGRYGGTFAHRDIAFEFASWLSPEFKLYIIKEFQRLKELEKTTIRSLEWQMKRSIVKTNYRIHTDAIQLQIKNLELTQFQENLRYAEEGDLLNLIMFGKKAKEWKSENPDLNQQGLNMRDTATIEELIVLSGLETLNAFLINQNTDKYERITKLTEEAKRNLKSIQSIKSIQDLKKQANSLPLN
jgi:KilA-N domain